MAITIRPYARGGLEVDIRILLPDGSRLRERRKSPVGSPSATKRWAECRERHLLRNNEVARRKTAPTLAEFWPRFIEGHCLANRHKPSGIDGKESVFRNHLAPLLGHRRLDALGAEDIAKLKSRLVDKMPATVNNALTVLSMLLKVAVEWDVIERVPARVRLLKLQKVVPRFYDFDEFGWLIDAAAKLDERILIVVLLAGEAGLRRGEIIALDWSAVDLRRGRLIIERSEWKGRVTETKGMDYRIIPLTNRLRAALAAHRHLRGDRVLYTDAGATVTAKVLQKWTARAQRRAGLRATGALHLLRHTFCSHLAMRGAPAIAIQHLAGHKNLQTTLRYMHLASGETERAISLLNGSAPTSIPNPVAR